MAPARASFAPLEQPWFKDFLEGKGFTQNAPCSYSNGRATIRQDGTVLIATPADGTRAWRTDVREASAEAIRGLLTVLLSTTPFLSPVALEQRASRQRSAEAALRELGQKIFANPDSHSSQQLRRFVWSLFNGHHSLNLWRLKAVLDSQHTALVDEVFGGWMQGLVPEDALRRTLTDSGEMDRWEVSHFSTRGFDRLTEAMDAVNDILKTTPPGKVAAQMSRANDLLLELSASLRRAKDPSGGE